MLVSQMLLVRLWLACLARICYLYSCMVRLHNLNNLTHQHIGSQSVPYGTPMLGRKTKQVPRAILNKILTWLILHLFKAITATGTFNLLKNINR